MQSHTKHAEMQECMRTTAATASGSSMDSSLAMPKEGALPMPDDIMGCCCSSISRSPLGRACTHMAFGFSMPQKSTVLSVSGQKDPVIGHTSFTGEQESGTERTEGSEGKLARLRPADWYFCRSAVVSGVLPNMLAMLCRLICCGIASAAWPTFALLCAAKGDGRPELPA